MPRYRYVFRYSVYPCFAIPCPMPRYRYVFRCAVPLLAIPYAYGLPLVTRASHAILYRYVGAGAGLGRVVPRP